MSKRKDKVMSLSGIDSSAVSKQQLKEYFYSYLDSGMHGIGFSAYEEGQEPGDELSREQVERRMAILKPHVKWVRSFSCCQGNDLIPTVAKDMGLKTLVGDVLKLSDAPNFILVNDPYALSIAVQGLKRLAADLTEIVWVGNSALLQAMVKRDAPESTWLEVPDLRHDVILERVSKF